MDKTKEQGDLARLVAAEDAAFMRFIRRKDIDTRDAWNKARAELQAFRVRAACVR